MTDSSSVQAPAPGGCCAAGEGFERALGLLSDAAFKVFAHLCLRAARAGGTLEFERSQLAQQVGKSRSALGRCLQELVRAGVCRIDPAPNQHRRSRLRLCAPFWPAAALAQTAAAEVGGAPPSAAASSSAAEYVASVREAFLQPRCVQGRFNADDARLAQAWQRSGVSLETVRRAILLGCTRKSMALLGQPRAQPIRSLYYFQALLQEVLAETYPRSYWQHLRDHLERCEQLWAQAERSAAPQPACPNLTPAEPQPTLLAEATTHTGERE